MRSPQELVKYIYSEENLARIDAAKMRYEIYNGKLKETIRKAIVKEFILPETVSQMIERIIPVNITQKVVNKLAGVYIDDPVREEKSGLEADSESLELLADVMQTNKVMKSANRYFKLMKSSLLEFYLSSKGKPSLRALPNHCFTLFSDDEIDPNKPTEVVKHLALTENRKNDLHVYWSDTNHYVFNGNGEVVQDLLNPEMVNPYQTLPFIYINESQDLLNPILDDDLISLQVAICLLLTDLAFATKYQAWSIIYLIGVETEKLSFNPSSVISLPMNADGTKPEIGTIKPSLDSDAMLRQVEALISLLLTTKNLSVNSVSASGINAQNAASGVAKILDSAESTEDRRDQIQYFAQAEKELWNKIAFNAMPYWISSGLLDPQYAAPFSSEFQLSISYPDMAPVVSESEKVDIEVKKLSNGLSSKSMSIKALNPEFSDDEVKQIMVEIEKERAAEMEIAANPEMLVEATESSEEQDETQGE